jgi:hypothetical protein
MLCSILEVNRYFWGTCHLHLQGQRISQARNQHKAGIKQSLIKLVSCLAYSLTLKMEEIFLQYALHYHNCENFKSYLKEAASQ